MKKTINAGKVQINGKTPSFQTKFDRAVEMLPEISAAFPDTPLLVVADSWFGNHGLFKPMRKTIGRHCHMLSRLRVSDTLHAIPPERQEHQRGRPEKYGYKMGNATTLASELRQRAATCSVNLYGKQRDVVAYDSVVMLKTLKCPVRVVWVYRRSQWVALFTTDLDLTVEQIIEYYGARWKIEAVFKGLYSKRSNRRSVAQKAKHETAMPSPTISISA